MAEKQTGVFSLRAVRYLSSASYHGSAARPNHDQSYLRSETGNRKPKTQLYKTLPSLFSSTQGSASGEIKKPAFK